MSASSAMLTCPGQIIGPAPDWSMSLVDVSDAPDPQAAAERWMRADLAEPVDLTRGPLFAYALLKAAADRFFWYSRYHHIVMDGFGFALVARRVADVYSALVAGRAAEPATFGSLGALCLKTRRAIAAPSGSNRIVNFGPTISADLPGASDA